MADVNYMNPSALDPGVGFKPEGFLGGMEWQRRNQMFTDAQSLQELMSRNSAVKSNIEANEFQQFAPTRQAKNLAELETANAIASTVGRSKEQEVRNLEATGRNTNALADQHEIGNTFERTVQPSKIASTIAKHALEQQDAGVKGLQNQVQAFKAVATQMAMQGPGAAANAAQLLQQAGVPRDQVYNLIGDGRPETIMKNFKNMMEILLQADNQVQSNLRGIQMQGQNQLAVQGLANAGSLATANARMGAKNKTWLDVLKGAKTPDDMIGKSEMALSDPDIDPNTRLAAEALKQKGYMLRRNADALKAGPGVTKDGFVPPKLNYSEATPGQTSSGVINWSELK